MPQDPTAQIPLVLPTAAGVALAATLCSAGPIVLATWWRRRSSASWRAFGAGALVFFVAQVLLRLPWQLPLGRWVQMHPEWLIPFLLFSSLTAGLFEESGRWLGYRYLIGERTRPVGVMFGLGHGAMESLALVGLPLAGILVSWFLAAQGSIESGPALDAIRQRTAVLTFWNAQLAVWERTSAIAVHVGLALIVLQFWSRGGFRWVLLAMVLHFGANVVPALLQYLFRVGPVVFELALSVIGAAILFAGWRLSRRSALHGPAISETA